MVVISAKKKRKIFNKILSDIKSVKIQGARNIAKKALYAYSLIPSLSSKDKLVSARPTEPMLKNVLDKFNHNSYNKLISHFDKTQDSINKNILKIIKNRDKIFTHCHSTNVVNALKYSKKNGKNFEVYNTETRPLYQGRKTASELKKAGIKVTQFVDSGFAIAIEKENKKDKIYSNKVFLGADAILTKGIINKIGSKTISELAMLHKLPLYVIADSWKFSKNQVPIEQRKLNEVWDKAPQKIKINNPAFEFVPKKYIYRIISEFGILKYADFVKKQKNYN